MEKEKKELFRKVALDRLSSPEQLDALMRVTSPAGWQALLAICALLALALWWGWVGEIGTRVDGQGILIRSRGVLRVVALGEGQISELVAVPGDMVKRGQVVARVDQPALLDDIRNARAELDEAKAQHAELEEFTKKDLAFQKKTFQLQRDALAEQRKTLQSSIAMMQSHYDWLAATIKDYERLLKEKVVISENVEEKRIALNSTRERMEVTTGKLGDLTVQEQDLAVKENAVADESERALLNSQHKINSLERKIQALQDRLSSDSLVVSKYAGRVIEVMAGKGDVVRGGTTILSVEPQDDRLEAVIYVKANEGKKIKPGMPIDLAVSTAEKEKYGSLLGLATSVSDYPASTEGMMHVLGNEQLVKKLTESGQGAPIEIRAELIPDNSTRSGYKWSSSAGPPIKIQSGTLCGASITISRERPIELVIPIIKSSLGL